MTDLATETYVLMTGSCSRSTAYRFARTVARDSPLPSRIYPQLLQDGRDTQESSESDNSGSTTTTGREYSTVDFKEQLQMGHSPGSSLLVEKRNICHR
jgi:hypothetical protein